MGQFNCLQNDSVTSHVIGGLETVTALRRRQSVDIRWRGRAVEKQVNAVCWVHGSNWQICPVPQSCENFTFLFTGHNQLHRVRLR